MKEPLDELLVQASPSNARIWRRWNSWNQPMCQCHLCRRCAAHPGGC